MKKQRILFWVDLEMTGLSDEQVIIEIASLVTDAELNILAEGPEIAIKRSKKKCPGWKSGPQNSTRSPGY